MNNNETIIKSPEDCTTLELDSFEKMVKEGGQVSFSGLRSRIERSEKLIFIWQGDVCVAIAGLKNPAQTYKMKVFEASGVADKIDEYIFEIGYIYANIKGVGNKLMQGILDASKGTKVFATTQNKWGQCQL